MNFNGTARITKPLFNTKSKAGNNFNQKGKAEIPPILSSSPQQDVPKQPTDIGSLIKAQIGRKVEQQGPGMSQSKLSLNLPQPRNSSSNSGNPKSKLFLNLPPPKNASGSSGSSKLNLPPPKKL